jgi:glycerol uptake facilitator protein
MIPAVPPRFVRCVAEGIGTFVLVFFGCGAVHVIVAHGALLGLWQVAVVWAVAIMLAIYLVGGISGAHINPAITLALVVWGKFSPRDSLPYVAAQLVGAIAAASVLFALFHPFLTETERRRGVVRGQPGSELTAACYGEYFPNPGLLDSSRPYDYEEHKRLELLVPESTAMVAEFLGTAILALTVFAFTDGRNPSAPPTGMAPVFIGLTVAVLIVVIAPLTQACFNPARDFGPRLVAWHTGWGPIALPGPRGYGFFTVYVLSPIAGAIVGGGMHRFLFVPAWTRSTQQPHEVQT